MQWLQRALDILLPPHPFVRLARQVTAEELGELMKPERHARDLWIYTLWPYREPKIRACIKAIKYYGQYEVAKRMGTLAAEYILEFLNDQRRLGGLDEPTLVPIPCSPQRLRKRGYNQAAWIAEVIAKEISLRCEPGLLARTERPSQAELQPHERAKNVAGAFYVPPDVSVENRTILLVDNMASSGSTLRDARRALLEAGAKNVIAIALSY